MSSYAIDDGERLLLFDPLGVPSELLELAAGRETAIVLTAPWHERDAESLVERLGVPTYGFTPLRLEPGEPFLARYHGVDERVGLDALRFGLPVLYDVVASYCG